MCSLRCAQWVVLPLLVFTSLGLPALADTEERGEGRRQFMPPTRECTVSVRAIRGMRRMPESIHQRLEAGKFLADVKPQLEAIPYSSFRVIDSTERRIKVGSHGDFTLVNAGEVHTLSVKPCSVSGQRVQVAVEWTGPSGSSILSTKVGIVKGKTVVVGTDSSGDSSMIMCIRVDC